MTSIHEHVPTQVVMLTYSSPMDAFEAQPTTDVRRTTEISSSSSVTDISLPDWAGLNQVVFRFTENVRAMDTWRDLQEQILRRIDQNATVVVSKELLTDRISRFMPADQDIPPTFFEVAFKMWSRTYETERSEDDQYKQLGTASQCIQRIRYDIALSDTLFGRGFQASNPYVDQKGGLIIDYFRVSDRITLVYNGDSVHVLTYVGGHFKDRLFSPVDISQLAVKDFLDGILLATL